MSQERRPEEFLAQPIDLPEAQCIIGDVYRTLIAYQELGAKNGFSSPQRVQRFLNRLFLANEDMREWALEHLQRTREEIGIDPDFAQLAQGIKEAADQIHRAMGPLLSRDPATKNEYVLINDDSANEHSSHQGPVQFPPSIAPLLANILSCLALRAQTQRTPNPQDEPE